MALLTDPLRTRGAHAVMALAAGGLALVAWGWLVLLQAEPAAARGAPQSFADLAERLMPAVVNISTTNGPPAAGTASQREKEPEGFFDAPQRKGPGVQAPVPPPTSLGSGFIIDPAGYVVTNNHVISGASKINVVLADGRKLAARLIGRDTKTDLALLKVDAPAPLPFVEFGDSDSVRVGDWVLAVGNPFGLGNSVTAGIISALGRDINAGPYDDFLQTDAPINRGNSGGPMFDMNGRVIGINTLIFSPTGASVGIGFATPASLAKPVIEQLRAHGRVRRGWLGVRIQAVTEEVAHRLALGSLRGALVGEVLENSPAAGALMAGDVILAFDGHEIETYRHLPRLVAETPVGKEVALRVWRDGREVELTLAVGELDETAELAALDKVRGRAAAAAVRALGLELALVTPELRDRFGLAQGTEGVVVTAVDPALVTDADIRPGDLILEVAHARVATPEDVASAIRTLAAAEAAWVPLLRERAGERKVIPLRLSPG